LAKIFFEVSLGKTQDFLYLNTNLKPNQENIMANTELMAKPGTNQPPQIADGLYVFQKPNPKKKTQLFRRVLQRIFPRPGDKEWITQIHQGMEQGRKAAMLNVHRNNRVK
jgi:hypothetical protein